MAHVDSIVVDASNRTRVILMAQLSDELEWMEFSTTVSLNLLKHLVGLSASEDQRSFEKERTRASKLFNKI